jgi:monoterpene epsilon-lactone hydrolase
MASPEFTAIHDALLDNPPSFVDDDVIAERRSMEDFMAGAPTADGATVEDLTVAGLPGLRISPPRDGGGVILYLHGGAYRIGSPACYRGFASHLAVAVGATVVVVDYRLAPEDPFPAAVDDAVAAYRALLDAGTPPTQLAIAGDSAGGGLTVATLLALRDAGLPQPAAGVCISPWADLTVTADSYDRCAATDPYFSRAQADVAAADYLRGVDPTNPLASPALADLSGLAPVLVHASDCEVLADDAVLLAAGIEAAGGDIELQLWPEMTHVWHIMTPHVPEARDAVDQAATFIRSRTQ